MLFILDSTYFDKAPGTVTFTPIEELLLDGKRIYSQHQANLIDLLKVYRKSVKGFVIGIEVEEINFCLELSDILTEKFLNICNEINDFIIQNSRRIYNA